MGRTKELWIAECERICEDYQSGKLTHDEAFILLKQRGWERDQINDELAVWAEA